MSGYLDNSGREDMLSGGARTIQVDTPKGPYRVWVKRTGNNPSLRVLLLHGGPGATHEYLEACDSFLPGAGIEYYYYDQLGSLGTDPGLRPLMSPKSLREMAEDNRRLYAALNCTSVNYGSVDYRTDWFQVT